MNEEKDLIEKLQRIEALFARAGTPGEKAAAFEASMRIRRRLEEVAREEPPTEFRFSIAEGWSRKLLAAMLHRYGIRTYRYRGQRRTTLMARVSKRFIDETLWPQYLEYARVLEKHVNEITERIIARAVSPDFEDGEVVDGGPGHELSGPQVQVPGA
ncbi:MAG: hypothetical protein JNM84_19200 [Planctomycetes bacterium]|nr:hypothetical protein [Planctomycetota bacterium]